jgi:hypothetical protein
MAATYEPIASIILGTTATSVTFSSVPQTYTDLILIATTKRNATGLGEANMQLTVNGDTSAAYSTTLLFESPSSTRQANTSTFDYASGTCGDGGFIFNSINLMNYSNTTTHKTVLTRNGYNQTNPQVRLAVGVWRNTAAITSLTMTPASGFAIGSTFNLYGILGANA